MWLIQCRGVLCSLILIACSDSPSHFVVISSVYCYRENGIVQADMDVGVGCRVNSIPSWVQSVRLVLCISSPHPRMILG